MRMPRIAWGVVVTAAVMIGAYGTVQRRLTPLASRHSQVPPEQSVGQPTPAAGQLPEPSALQKIIMPDNPLGRNDPSLDPKVLERAFVPPPPPSMLPPDARPKRSAIEPPRRTWQERQRYDSAVAY